MRHRCARTGKRVQLADSTEIAPAGVGGLAGAWPARRARGAAWSGCAAGRAPDLGRRHRAGAGGAADRDRRQPAPRRCRPRYRRRAVDDRRAHLRRISRRRRGGVDVCGRSISRKFRRAPGQPRDDGAARARSAHRHALSGRPARGGAARPDRTGRPVADPQGRRRSGRRLGGGRGRDSRSVGADRRGHAGEATARATA